MQIMKILIICLILIVCLLAFVIVCSAIDNRKLVIRNYIVQSNKVHKDVRVAFLSDMHDNELGENNCGLINAVKDVKADVILIGGDMITAHPGCTWDKAVKLVKGLSQLGLPIIYGMGNHEYRMDRYREDYGDAYDVFMKELKSAGATIVRNECVNLNELGINVQGLMIDRKYYKRWGKRSIVTANDVREYVGDKVGNDFEIMLAHNPEYFDAYSYFADVVLSGHVHGGIMVLPFLGGVISPRLTLFPKYDGGRFDKEIREGQSSTMIVSRGLGTHTLPIRIFNPLELVVVDIKAIK